MARSGSGHPRVSQASSDERQTNKIDAGHQVPSHSAPGKALSQAPHHVRHRARAESPYQLLPCGPQLIDPRASAWPPYVSRAAGIDVGSLRPIRAR
jgi:hypothetical protein